MNLDENIEVTSFPRPTSVHKSVEATYRIGLNRIKKRESKLIDIYICPEFLELKKWLRETIGDDRANQIMEDGL